MKKKAITHLLSAALFLGSASAMAIDEAEPNNTVGSAQLVSANWGGIKIAAMMGELGQSQNQDVDFYKFKAKAGDVLTIDIDNGYSSSAPLDTVVAIFGPAPDYKILRMEDKAASLDEGSSSMKDARIDDFVAPASGTYTVGVTTVPRSFISGGVTLAPAPVMSFGGSSMGGDSIVKDYTLDISGVSADSVKKINIEVKPGSDELAPLNPRSKGKIPVAVLGSADFSVMTIDKSSLTFGATGEESSLFKCAKSVEDVNDDGQYDLVCHFENQAAGFNGDSLEGILKGKTESGEAFEGRAFLKVVPKM